jgi:hypothetical protein
MSLQKNMGKLLFCSILLISTNSINAQAIDTLSFIKSKMSDDDLLKKREGTFITGLPDFSSDPVTGFGFVLEAMFIGERTNPSFALYTLFSKVKANVAYYTSNAES